MEKRATFSNLWLAAAFIAPQMLLIFVFFYWPSGEALYWAVTLEPPFGGSNQWVGLQNFTTVFQDPKYWASVWVSLTFAFSATVLSLAIATLLALFVDRRLPGHQVYKFTFFLPYALAAPAVGLAFRFIFSPDAGFVSVINRAFPGFWNPALNGYDAFTLIVLAQSWKMVGYNFIFFLAALQSIPRTISEAGAVDGASVLRRMWDIQLPLITPTLFFLIVINITDSFVDSFGIVDITTSGGPARATELMVYKIYTDGFQGKDYSLAAAQSIVLMLLVIALTFIQFRFVERRVHYR
ncbi:MULTISPECIES: ABC transporter permease subunit [Phyllobacteriaceae]|uniref:sn-glycerol-3-phosphate transport system permease protein UgpA n=1 Tax=Mesorhizobium hungaricum TaxID=1566387 RepID=A0A1C2DFZ9_9HYPH|nr:MULTISPECIES: ABC transporter permease subunit [Mesorhizobium]MBN9232256.1 ABC transporter permease subunit [Mesorhizobium sp.]MDQ0329852.1 sn-glycerol 3-phosphate transport system permease protein [Mesorhizobium sp. YL-MeA3-2017]OCX13566.1 glycerol-3-phosphate transporter permease [Mesorhizobium hungaricum]